VGQRGTARVCCVVRECVLMCMGLCVRADMFVCHGMTSDALTVPCVPFRYVVMLMLICTCT
jgi:hypothetical protein